MPVPAGLEIPPRIARLPLDPDRGYPVPYFVTWIDGKPEFRVVDGKKIYDAVTFHLCHVCGEKLGGYVSFLIGPMCTVNRISAEPPMHRECADFSARACPFLINPDMVRRENDLPANTHEPAGLMLKGNPGTIVRWDTRHIGYTVREHNRGLLFGLLGEPLELVWYREGRLATRDEVLAAYERGCPNLRRVAEEGGPTEIRRFEASLAQAVTLRDRLWRDPA